MRILRRGGVFMGIRLNAADDAIDIGLFLGDWIPTYIESVHRGVPLPPARAEEMRRAFHEALAHHLQPRMDRGQPYGWKEPRSIYLLPFFDRQLSGLRFLHLIRDGRDMAFSSNRNQLNNYGNLMIQPELAGCAQPVRSIALWSRINQWAADYGEARMGRRYLRVRFEDLCAEPVFQVRRIWRFLDLQGDPDEVAQDEVVPPESIGRWQSQDPDVLEALQEIGGTALRRFGYL